MRLRPQQFYIVREKEASWVQYVLYGDKTLGELGIRMRLYGVKTVLVHKLSFCPYLRENTKK